VEIQANALRLLALLERNIKNVTQNTSVPDTAAEEVDVSQGGEMTRDSPYQFDDDHAPSSEAISADNKPSRDELIGIIMAPAGIDARKSCQIVPLDDQSVSDVAEATAAHPAGDVIIPLKASVHACDEPLMTPVGDEIKSQSAADDGLPVNGFTSAADKTGDDSDAPVPTPVSATTTSQNVAHEFRQATTVIPGDGGKSSSAVDGDSSTVTLQQMLSSRTAAAVSDGQIEAGDVSSPGSIRDAGLQSAARQLPDSIHAQVGLDRPTQIEFTAGPADVMGQPQDAAGPCSIQQVSEVKHVEVEAAAGDFVRTDVSETARKDRDEVTTVGSSSSYGMVMGELVEQKNRLLDTIMTLCSQADVCTSAANSDVIRAHICHLQACWKLHLLICTTV